MRTEKTVHWVAMFTVGLFAGLLYTFAQGVLPTLDQLDARAYAMVERGLVTNLDAFPTGVIGVATIAMLAPLYPLIRFWRRRDSAYWRLTLLAWLLFFFGVGLFTIVLNVPINNYVLSWDPANPPADWAEARSRWAMLNSIRTPINLISFGLLLWAAYELPRLEQSDAPATQVRA
jgi:uncharacterized membrane protein